ncbi:hypothetical protein DFH08DRAFT_722242 [Mycena albidolilacea]|uniref:Uncharacterized protein n=1 Tax=Mycena albidolilacea TaxID=1033008 RepID=A0AAD6Z1J4_9AGAR|nr:hypothetical protein DFH08DRAFT_722242 [Mycena albidolilacea]
MCLIARLQERTGRTHFKVVDENPARCLLTSEPITTELDTDLDLAFTNPGTPLKTGSQCLFTKLISSMNNTSVRRNTMINLECIRSSIAEEFSFQPSDKAIWTSIRSTNIHRLTRNFLWKCIHNIYYVGPFWEHIPSLETFGLCETCRVTESMEHILLEGDNPGQHQIWTLTKNLWRLRFPSWPKLNSGLILGCGLARFKSPFTHVKNCFFTILVSTAIKLI